MSLTNYNGVIIKGHDRQYQSTNYSWVYVPKDSTAHEVTIGWYGNGSEARKVTVTNTGVQFSTAHQRFDSDNTAYNRAIPLEIYGTTFSYDNALG